MINRTMKQGFVGVSLNHDSSLALLQVTDDNCQARAALTEKQLVRLIGELGKLEQHMREDRLAEEGPALDEPGGK